MSIKFESTTLVGIEEAIRGMRNPMNSWDKSDSQENYVGVADKELMLKLAKAGRTHAKFRRMIAVYVDITAPLYWWKEFDTYKVGTVANSCSTMHKIHERDLTLDDFSIEHLMSDERNHFKDFIGVINSARQLYIDDPRQKEYWWQMIQMLPSSYNQKRTIMMNYEVLANIYETRKNHKLDEWRAFCKWIEKLPYSYVITLFKET